MHNTTSKAISTNTPSFSIQRVRGGLLAAAVALFMVGCGGSGEPVQLVVFGDSLADGGTHGGIRATVQSGTSTPTPMYPDLVQAAYSSATLCQVFINTGSTVVLNTSSSAAGCTNYAVGGGRVSKSSSQADAYDIRKQMETAASRYSTYTTNHLGLIDGGGNDAADLVSGYLGGTTNFQTTLLQQLSSAELTAALTADSTGASAGVLFMQKLADAMYVSTKANLLDRGMQKVVLINAPLITNTPRFSSVLLGVQNANGGIGSTSGVAAATGVTNLTKAWVSAYNTRLSSKFSGDSRVAIVDFYATYNDQLANPAKYGLTNVTATACPATGTGTDGLPTYTFSTCTEAALNVSTPTWKTYLHSDGFHPTPLGHVLMANSIKTAAKAAGWL